MKKLVSLVLALSMLCSLGVAMSEEEQKTLSVICPVSSLVEDYDTNGFILWLEEQTGIDVEWIQVPSASWADKISAVILSGDLPDVITFGGQYTNSRTTQQNWANEGVIIPMDDMITEWGVYSKLMFEEQPGLDTMITLNDGHIYALPTYSDIIHTNYSSRMVVNDEFLKALGMEKPTTLDEFYDYLVGVRDNDVNGNGDPSDEIPYVALNNWGGDPYTFLMNSFISYNGRTDKLDITEDGTIYSVVNQDAFREGLAFMNKLYDEGLIYEGSLSLDGNGCIALGESGNGYDIIGCQTGTGIQSGIAGGEIYSHYSGLAPLTGYTGLRQTPWYRYVNVRESAWMITSDCEDTQAAFELGDFMLSYDSTMRLRKGVYGENWTEATEGQTTIDGRQATFVELIPYNSEVQNNHLDNDLMFYETRGVFLDDRAFGTDTTDLWDPLNRQFWLSETAKEYYIPYGREVLPTISILADDLDEYNIIATDLDTYVDEWMAAFLNGEADIEDDGVWAEYVQGLEDLGLERYVEIYAASYEVSSLKWGA